jgi:hypothetical protein
MDYYVIEPENDDSHPMLSWDDQRNRNVARNEEVDLSPPLRLRLGSPVPNAPRMVDFHILPEPVVSRKVADVLAPLKMHLVQLVPAAIDVNGSVREDYFLLHVRNRIECLDMARSRHVSNDRGEILVLQKAVLDEQKLGTLPERERFVFRPLEYSGLWLFHETVMSRIEAVAPVGLRFFHVRDWDDAAAFT